MANHLYVNQSKCLIAQEEVEYLGHVISATGVAADSTKIQSMADWPTPTTTTGLRDTELWQFIQNYGTIVAPLT